MITNYLTIAYRNLAKNKTYSAITIFGLALGLACVFLITYYVRTELSYDRHHVHADDIFRVIWATDNPQTRTPHPLANAMAADFEEVVSGVSITPLWGVGLTRETFSFRNLEKDIRFDESNVIAVDTTFFDVFSLPMISGDPKTVLKNTGGVLISASMAKKYFGDENPMGKQLAVNNEKQLVEVLGVFQDLPPTSHFRADFLVSYLREKSFEDPESLYYTWDDFGHYNYIRLKPGANVNDLEARMIQWVRKYIDASDEEVNWLKAQNYGFRLQPLTSIHLHSHIRWELEPNGYIGYVYMMTAAGILILVIGCVNFINLTTAQSTERAREIGVRKSLGANRLQLAVQFSGESLLVSLVATLLAGLLIELGSPWFTAFTGQEFKADYLYFLLVLGAFGTLTGLVAGLFPSLYLSSLQPGLVLKGRHIPGKRGGLRPVFTVFQFFASMVLVSTSLIIYQQLEFLQHQELGFRPDEVIIIPIKDNDPVNPRFEDLRHEMLKVPGVNAVAAASNVPGKSFNQNPVFSTENPELRVGASEVLTDYELFHVLGIELADGRLFSRDNPADREGFVINETLANNLYGGKAVGKEFNWDYDSGPVKGTIIGVVKDFHFQSLHKAVDPLMFRLSPNYNYVVINLSTADFNTTIQAIEKVWRTVDTQFAFDFSFLSDDLNLQYAEEQNMANVLGAFSGIAVAIACFGLLGIAALTFRQRTKEVSIRKVLGANRSNLMMLLIKDFTTMILVAILLAVPLVWWMMSEWLQHFTLRVTINPILFAGSGLLLMLFAWTTLAYLTWKVSNVNPAETLKSE